ncbi:MAG: ribonuclease Z [Bacteroidota bacterium]
MRFDVLILGSSAALPTADRFCSGQLLRAQSTQVLIDCGEGSLRQLQAAGASYGKISLILITHLHGDHYFGLPGLLTSLALNDRKKPLLIVSPPGLKEKVAPLLEMGKYELPFALEFQELDLPVDDEPLTGEWPRHLFDHGDLGISYFPLQHRIPTAGYLLEERRRQPNIRPEQLERFQIPFSKIKEIKAGASYETADGQIIPNEELVMAAPEPRSFAYCSDTRYFPELSNWVSQVDLLYHEATFLHEMQDRAIETKHTTALEAATLAKDAQVSKLIIGHFSSRYPKEEVLVTEARTVFPETVGARELERHAVAPRGRRSSDVAASEG